MQNNQVVAYASKKLKLQEENYPTQDLDLAVVFLFYKSRYIVYMDLNLRSLVITRDQDTFLTGKNTIWDKEDGKHS